MKFPIVIQPDSMDCGPVCLKMISSFYDKEYPIDTLREFCNTVKDGVSLMGISKAAEKIGFKTIGGRLTVNKLTEKAPLPCILHWNQEHFVVLYKVKKKKKGIIFYIADPGKGLLQYKEKEFTEH
jgi:ATP-binding cassette subfamily B protein